MIYFYIKPHTWKRIPTTKIPKIITIGETFFFKSHMQRKVSSKPAKPGTSMFKLSCKVVTLYLDSDKPAAC